MARFGSIDSLRQWQTDLKAALDPRKREITLCGGTGCSAFGSPDVQKAFEEELARRGLGQTIGVKRTGCHGFCEKGPLVVILPEKIFYASVQVEDVPEIIEKTILNRQVIRRLLYIDPATGKRVVRDHDVPFYAKQRREVFRLNGLLDPISLEDYVARDGYAAAVKALSAMTPEQVIDEVLGSGLRAT